MTFASHRGRAASVLAALAVAAATLPAHAAGYVFTRLPSLGGTSSNALGLDAQGDVVGESSTVEGSSRATVWRQGVAIDLGVGDGSAATAINRHGVIVGNGGRRAFRWEDGVFQWLPVISYFVCCDASASGINDDGVIVGDSQTYAVQWTDLVMTRFLPPGLIDWSTGINNRGQVAVMSSHQWTGPPSQIQFGAGMVYTGSASQVLPSVCESLDGYTVVSAINDRGQTAGYCYDHYPEKSNPRAIRWGADTSPVALENPGGSLAYAIGPTGWVVGQTSLDNVHWHAALWRGTKLVDLRRYIDPALRAEGWVLTSAHAINASGVIAGQMENRQTRETAAWTLEPR